MRRACGVLMPVFSLPGPYGIGCFSVKAYEFVDHLREAGQSYWQLLPLGPTGYGDSPYQSFSSFAGNPYFIDPDELAAEGLLSEERLRGLSQEFFGDSGRVDYGRIWQSRGSLLREAYANFRERLLRGGEGAAERYREECGELCGETLTYCLYRAVKDSFGGRSWSEWEAPLRLRAPEALAAFRAEHEEEIAYYVWEQLQFRKQWKRLRSYANEHGVQIVGDMPIYVAPDSSDAWAHPELFQFDEDARPTAFAGCPPDYFSPEGQLWGNPVYRWEAHEKTGFAWWFRRMEYALKLYDYVRMDHFRGFESYYAIPAGAESAAEGAWEKGPGLSFFQSMGRHFEDRFAELPIIAEDLGFLTEEVLELVRESGFPSMKVLEFAFDGDHKNLYLPHNYPRNCVAYTGTHDNQPLTEWIRGQGEEQRFHMIRYLGGEHTPEKELFWDCIRSLLGSVADTVVIPMWDYLGAGAEARINTPSVPQGNWQWRMRDDAFSCDLSWHLNLLSSIYGRKAEK